MENLKPEVMLSLMQSLEKRLDESTQDDETPHRNAPRRKITFNTARRYQLGKAIRENECNCQSLYEICYDGSYNIILYTLGGVTLTQIYHPDVLTSDTENVS